MIKRGQSFKRGNHCMSTIQKCLLSVNLAVGVAFFVLFVTTFVARAYIDDKARDFAQEKTEEHATPLVGDAQGLLDGELAQRFLPEDVIEAARHETVVYQDDPAGYVAQLVSEDATPAPVPSDVPFAETIFGWKHAVRDYYHKVLGGLIRELRIFTGTNVLAAWVAAFLVWFPATRHKRGAAVLSIVLLIALAYNAWMYIDSSWFFRILLNAYLGWWYPVGIALTVVAILRDWRWLIEKQDVEHADPLAKE